MASPVGQLSKLIQGNGLSGPNSRNFLLNMPTELLQQILSHVDGVSALAVRATCRTLRSEVDYLSPVDLKNLQTAFIQINPNPQPGTAAIKLSPLGQKLLLGIPLISKHQLGFVLRNLPFIKIALENTHASHQDIMDIRGSLIKNYQLNHTLDEQFLDDIDDLIAAHPSLDANELETPAVEKHINEIIENPSTPGDLLHKLFTRHQDDDFILAVIASHPHLQETTARDLFALNNPVITEMLTENVQTPSDILHSICQTALEDGDQLSLQAVAKNANCDASTLSLLWKERDPSNKDILNNLLENPSHSLDTFAEMMQKPEHHKGLAQNPRLPAQHIETLLHSERVDVREALAKNPHLIGVADALSHESQPTSVRAAAARNPLLSDEKIDTLHKTGDKDILVGLTHNTSISVKLINTLARHDNPEISCEAALSPNLTDETLDKLSTSTNPLIQKSLLTNKAMQLYFSRI